MSERALDPARAREGDQGGFGFGVTIHGGLPRMNARDAERLH